MLPRLPTLLFLTSMTLGLSASSCSKKDDPAASVTGGVPGTASYKLNGQLIDCQPTVYINTSTLGDRLTVQLTTTPKPASSDERLDLYFWKSAGQPNSAYKLLEQRYYTTNTAGVGASLTSPNVTFAATSTGGFSGTFAGEAVSAAFSYSITEGVFTDLHP